MGGQTSKDERLDYVFKLFTTSEQEQMKQIYLKIKPFDQQNLMKYLGNHLSPQIKKNLYHYMKSMNKTEQSVVTEAAFIISLSHMLKGTVSDKTSVLCCLAAGSCAADSVSASSMQSVVTSLFESYVSILQQSQEYKTWRENDDVTNDLTLVSASIVKPLSQESSETVSSDSIEKWLSQSALLLHIMDHVFHNLFPVTFTEDITNVPLNHHLLPHCEGAQWNKMTTLLTLPTTVFLNHHLPGECHSPWRLLFSTRIHGESFSNMTKHILNQGPTVLVVKDTDGHVFGGFASESWTVRPQFVGSSHCFLFTLSPEVGVYTATEYNDHFMYFNHGQETMPNGLGMGGQLNYFGLWLDQEFGDGHSHAEPFCTTFNSPQLSGQSKFKVAVLEVWGVGREPKALRLNEDGEEIKESILDKDPEAKAMLELLDKGPLSEGLRETDPTADTPEEHSRPF